ncbi:MAG: hypothetical protein LBK00_05920 [Treponema sp.]|nr:hypothetical protein [Treponema sp.]
MGRNSTVVSRNSVVVSRDSTVVSRNSVVVSRDSVVVGRDSTVVSRDSVVVSRDSTVVSRDSTVVSRDSVVVSRDSTVVSRDSTVVSRDSVVVSRDSVVVSRDSTVVSRDSAVVSRIERIDLRFKPVCLECYLHKRRFRCMIETLILDTFVWRYILAKKIASHALPRKEEELDALVNSMLTYMTPHVEGAGADWTDIPTASWTAFKAAHAAWVPAYAACKMAHLPKDTEAKNLVKTALCTAITDMLERGLFLAPRTSEDVVAMGFHLIDSVRTTVAAVNDAVDIDRIVNGTIPGSHSHVLYYHIEGKQRRAKAPYHLAVFQVYIKGAGDPEPILNSDRGWSKDYINMTEPFEMRHEPEDVGKTAYYRAHWETSSGVKGPWAMASAEVP